jgi:hypothetical protein
MCAGLHVYADLHSNMCPPGSYQIVTEEACRSAVTKANLSFQYARSYDSYPRGCYHWIPVDFDCPDGICDCKKDCIYFNPHPVGRPEKQSQLLCTVGTASPTLAPWVEAKLSADQKLKPAGAWVPVGSERSAFGSSSTPETRPPALGLFAVLLALLLPAG